MSSDNYTCCQLGGHLCQPLLHRSFKRFNNLHLVDLSSTSLKVVCTYVYSTTPKGAVCTNKHFSLTDQGAAGKIYRSNLKSKEILSSSLRRENSSLWFCPCPCPVICPLFLPCNFCPVNFALCFALLVFVLLFLPLPLGWYFHFHCGCCVRGHFLITMIFLFQMLDLLLKTDGG